MILLAVTIGKDVKVEVLNVKENEKKLGSFMFEKILNLIFPNVCGFCNKIDKNSLCKNCELSLTKYEINCIKDYTKDNQKYFDYQYSALKYENIVREKIIK